MWIVEDTRHANAMDGYLNFRTLSFVFFLNYPFNH